MASSPTSPANWAWSGRAPARESPFDYPQQALLFVPRGMPEPQSPQFLDRFVQTLLPLLEASLAVPWVPCTTLRAVDKVANLLADAFDDAGHDWPLLKQGEGTRRDLLDRFCKLTHPVLVGSASFWEGIDLPGDVLTLVAIDKLPFAPPDDPVIEARLRACRAQGGNPSPEYQLPEAAISLKQGAGRLIRTESDWGVLMVGDARLVEKPYGKRLWRGLPPSARTRELEEVLAFYRRKQAQRPAGAARRGRPAAQGSPRAARTKKPSIARGGFPMQRARVRLNGFHQFLSAFRPLVLNALLGKFLSSTRSASFLSSVMPSLS